VQLPAKEFDLLVALAEDPERVFRKEELLRDV
jgi:DNA-binding winged helix-turn-helix (wHTH) protein